MSGGVKAGLLFGLVGVLAVVGISLLLPICSPLVAALVGGLAGYFGVRWSVGNAGVGTGVLAGSIAGIAMLLGSLVFFVVAFNLVRNDPQFAQTLDQILQQQQGGAELSPQELDAMLNLAAPLAGFCFGLLNLLFALALGAAGGAIAARNRPTTPSYYEPPMGPPPLSPQ